MDTEIHSIIEAVRTREERRRWTALAINATLLATMISVPIILWLFYPPWFALLWIVPLVVAGIFISQSKYQSIRVSREEASTILDGVLQTKERVRTFALISHSSAAPDLVRSAFIADQIRELLPPTCTPANLLDVRLTTPQRWALTTCAAALLLSLALLIFRPQTAAEEIAASLQEIVDAHPELPESVQLAIEQSIQDLSSSDLAAAQESLQKTQEEIAQALAAKTAPSKDERTIEQRDGASPKITPEAPQNRQPSPSPEQQREQKQQQEQQQKQQNENQQKQEKENGAKQPKEKDPSEQGRDQNQKQDTGQDKNQEKNKEDQQSQGSQQRSQEGSSEKGSHDEEKKGESEQEKDSKEDGKSQSGQSKKSEDGEGQGSGQGQGSSGSGSGNQGENKDQNSQSQGKSGAAQQGQGQGEETSQDAKGGPQSQGGSAKEGNQKEGSPSGASGLEQLKDAVDKASQEVQKEQQKQGGDQEGKQGEQGKGEGNKESAQGKESESKGSQGNKEDQKQQKEQQGKGDSKSSTANKKESAQDQKGEGKQGSQSKSESQNNDPKQKDKGTSGNTGEAPSQAQPEKEKEKQESGDSEADGAGDKSSMPDRSAKARDEAPPSPGEGIDPSTLPPPVKESQIGNEQEQLDARFTGGDSTLEESKKPAQAKTTLDDVILAKPQGSAHKGSQPIPLEYRDILGAP